jgi:hypothetical protein
MNAITLAALLVLWNGLVFGLSVFAVRDSMRNLKGLSSHSNYRQHQMPTRWVTIYFGALTTANLIMQIFVEGFVP